MGSFKRSRGNRVEQRGTGVSIMVNQVDPITSDHIRPNPTKSDQNQTRKKRIKMEGSSGNARKPQRTHGGRELDGAAEKPVAFSNMLGVWQLSNVSL